MTQDEARTLLPQVCADCVIKNVQLKNPIMGLLGIPLTLNLISHILYNVYLVYVYLKK